MKTSIENFNQLKQIETDRFKTWSLFNMLEKVLNVAQTQL